MKEIKDMPSNKLFTNIITGTAIVASLTTGGMAGMKVLASRNIDAEVPEVTLPSATPSASPSSAPIIIVPVSAIPVVGENDTNPSVAPSITPSVSLDDNKLPLASIVPGGRFDDDADSDDNELEHEETRGKIDNEKIETPDHEDN